MSIVLSIIGALIIIASIIVGILTRSGSGFFVIVIGGVISSIIYFGLAQVLDNQEAIQDRLYRLEELIKKPPMKIMCVKCEKEYDEGFSSCPHCAHRSEPLKKSIFRDVDS